MIRPFSVCSTQIGCSSYPMFMLFVVVVKKTPSLAAPALLCSCSAGCCLPDRKKKLNERREKKQKEIGSRRSTCPFGSQRHQRIPGAVGKEKYSGDEGR